MILSRFQQHRSYRDGTATRKREEIHFSLRIIASGRSVAEGPLTVLYNTAHLYIDQANPQNLVPKKLTFLSVLTKQCGVVSGLVDIWYHMVI